MEFSQLMNEVNKILTSFNKSVLDNKSNHKKLRLDELPYLKGRSIMYIYDLLRAQEAYIIEMVGCYDLSIDTALDMLDAVPDKIVTILR